MAIRRKCNVPFAERVTFPETLYAEGISTGNSGEVGDILTVLSLNSTFSGTNNFPVQITVKDSIYKKFHKISYTRFRSECILAGFHVIQYIFPVLIRDCNFFL